MGAMITQAYWKFDEMNVPGVEPVAVEATVTLQRAHPEDAWEPVNVAITSVVSLDHGVPLTVAALERAAFERAVLAAAPYYMEHFA